VAAAFDDLYYFLGRDEITRSERERGGRPSVVLITDGSPDNDYRAQDCDCGELASGKTCPDGVDPAAMHCPYPTAELAARTLRCGDSVDCTQPAGPAENVFVVGLDVRNDEVHARLDQIARSGGQPGAMMANDAEQLGEQLRALFEQIAR
jgi:hypothetical protein